MNGHMEREERGRDNGWMEGGRQGEGMRRREQEEGQRKERGGGPFTPAAPRAGVYALLVPRSLCARFEHQLEELLLLLLLPIPPCAQGEQRQLQGSEEKKEATKAPARLYPIHTYSNSTSTPTTTPQPNINTTLTLALIRALHLPLPLPLPHPHH